MGWMVEVIFPTGRAQLPAWHGGGVVVEVENHERGEGVEERVRVLYDAEGWDDWFSDPAGDVEVAFHKPGRCKRKRCSCKLEGPCISAKRLRVLRAAMVDD